LRSVYERFKPAWLTKESSPFIDAAISAVRHRVVERLAQDALDRGEIADAFALAEELGGADSVSETAYELLIRAYVRSGNNAAALREYRAYSERLMQDLGVAPSFSMEKLLQS
jgi:DNA-binding SARP family transcriptional activator